MKMPSNSNRRSVKVPQIRKLISIIVVAVVPSRTVPCVVLFGVTTWERSPSEILRLTYSANWMLFQSPFSTLIRSLTLSSSNSCSELLLQVLIMKSKNWFLMLTISNKIFERKERQHLIDHQPTYNTITIWHSVRIPIPGCDVFSI